MTFDDWMLTKDKSYVPTDDSMSLRLLRECWFSRDAEIATLKGMVNEIQAARHVQREHNDLLVKNHKLREQMEMLRDVIEYSGVAKTCQEIADALAATEPVK